MFDYWELIDAYEKMESLSPPHRGKGPKEENVDKK
jgi:hypothetical protein